MELVYLWVEDYKNIKKQGFNFSPRFECKFYDEYEKDENGKEKLKDNCKLEIKPKGYIENFFGDKINVTAIVGKNGSGKSSVLEVLQKIKEKKLKNDYILVFFDDKPFYLSSDMKITTDINNCDELNDNIDFILYNLNKEKNTRDTDYRVIDTSEQTIVDLLVTNYTINDKFENSTFMYIPQIIEIKSKSLTELIDNFELRISITNRIEIKECLETIEDREHSFLIIKYIQKECGKINLKECQNKETLKEKLGNDFQKDLEKLVKHLKMESYKLAELDNDMKKWIKEYYDFLTFDLIDKKERKYTHLSHGERVIFGQLLNIYFFLKNRKRKQIFLFDEPEIALHPNWQKKYLFEIISLFSKHNEKIHLIFTSHSPFLLSDIPKQNIIFLDTYKKDEDDNQKEGNCKVVDGLKQTFGANIHTLLSDSFFMDKGLMGEFARGKINKTKEFYFFLKRIEKSFNKPNIKIRVEKLFLKKQKEFEQIQSIIGEPFLKTVIKNYLDEVENILFDNKAKEMAIKRFVDEFDKDDIMKVLNDKS